MKKQVAPLFEAVKVCHDLWTQENDNTFLYESTKCIDRPGNDNCYYRQMNHSQEDMVKEYNNLEEDEDAFGAKSQKIVVQL